MLDAVVPILKCTINKSLRSALKTFSYVFILHLCIGCTPRREEIQVLDHKAVESIAIEHSNDQTVISISSLKGIGNATLKKTGPHWPAPIALQLHLKGLEHFEVYNGTTRLEAAVSNNGRDTRQWKDGNESTPLDPSSDYWMIIQTSKASTDTKTVGYFSITLPNRFLSDANQSIEIKWIDFYR